MNLLISNTLNVCIISRKHTHTRTHTHIFFAFVNNEEKINLFQHLNFRWMRKLVRLKKYFKKGIANKIQNILAFNKIYSDPIIIEQKI